MVALPRSCRLLAASLLPVAFAISSAARADLPPPDGTKNVSYGFRVEGLAAHPAYVLLAFPWSLSNGRPTEEHARVEDGKLLYVGRRSAPPKLYAMGRSDYDAFVASYKAPSDNFEDPALRTLFASPQVRACDVSPTAVHELSDDDPRSEVVESIRVVAIDGARCDLDAPPPADSAASPAKRGGCAGCHASPSGGPWSALPLGAVALLLLARRCRPRS